MTTAEIIKVRISAAGKEKRIPSSPIKIGIITGKSTPKTISRISERVVESPAFPSA